MNARGITALVVTFSAGLLPACGTTPSDGGGQTTPNSVHMGRHAAEAATLESAIVNGDLEAALAPAAWLNGHEDMDGMGTATQLFVTEMRDAAGGIFAATSLESAAMDLGRMGVACGGCHLATETTLAFEWDDHPAETLDIKTHMARHSWAVDRLWEGISGPSEEAWKKGAEILQVDALDREHTTAEAGMRYRAEAWDQLVHSLAEEAENLAPADKGEFYGQVVSACNSCHTLIRAGN